MIRAMLVGAILWLGVGHLRAQDLPPTPVPVAAPARATPETHSSSPQLLPQLGPPPAPILPPPAPLAPVVPSQPVYADYNGPLLRGDPLLQNPAYPTGWFGSFEVQLVAPHIKNRLQAFVPIEGFQPEFVHLPTAELDWTGAPKVTLGYRLPESLGEFLVAYRFLASEGRADLSNFDLDGSNVPLLSRLDTHIIDLDYATHDYALGSTCWDVKGTLGARLATIFFDSSANGLFLGQRTSNHFFGGGPHAGIDFIRKFDWPETALFTSLVGAAPVGQISQSFEEQAIIGRNQLVGGALLQHKTMATPMLELEAGLSWTPNWPRRNSRLTLGYHFERWWYLGSVGDSRAELTVQGLFVRGEVSF